MFSIWTLSAVTMVYLAILFVIASWANRKVHISNNVYSLALGVHCTSWAFFGTATQASQFSWPLVPTYFGCILVMLFGVRVLKKIAQLCRQYQISSLSEFIGIRYFHSSFLAVLVVCICVMGVIPYIALQLDAISDAVKLLSNGEHQNDNVSISFYIMLLMAAFVLVFGSRTLDLTQKHPGLMYSLAFESIIKLAAITIVGLYVVYHIHEGFFDLIGKGLEQQEIADNLNQPFAVYIFASHTLLGICAMFCLPRQFHVNFVENRNDHEIDRARWLFPLYLVGMTSFILPIAIAGDIAFGANSGLSDQYVLLLPMTNNAWSITVIAFIGGVAAATSMVIVATLALSNMINSSIINPLWVTLARHRLTHGKLSRRHLMSMRQLVICVLVFIAYIYHIYISQSAPLVKSGTIAIALLAQLLPALIFGLMWSKTNTIGVIAGITTGTMIVITQMLYPAMSASYYFESVPTDTEFADAIFLSLGLNVGVLACITLLLPVSKAHPFTRQKFQAPYLQISASALEKVMSSVLSDDGTRNFSEKLSNEHPSGFVNPLVLIQAEKLLSSHLGAASARIVLNSIADNQITTGEELGDLVGIASKTFKFKHEVLQSSLAHLPQGVSVVDINLELIAWNPAYETLFNLPSQMLQIGTKIATILEYNANKGLLRTLDNENISEAIERRLLMMKRGESYKVLRRFGKHKVIEISGSALPGGGYITAYTDITEHFETQQQLKRSAIELEQRVEERTKALEHAMKLANQANISKTKFLAAAGHDLMQPVNAATLFASMLADKLKHTVHQQTSENLLNALENVDQQLAMLLEISKLDSDRIQPSMSEFALNDVFRSLTDELQVVAFQKALRLDYIATSIWVKSDRGLLTRVLQNLISNAIRYTETGRVIMGVRRKHHDHIEIWVCDTGTGIAEGNLDRIFDEFSRLDRNRHDQGLGLGLTIVKKTCDLLGLQVNVASRLGHGSSFKIGLSRVPPIVDSKSATRQVNIPASTRPLSNKRLLVLENDNEVCMALQAQFADWGATVLSASCVANVPIDAEQFDLIFADFHLDHEDNGIQATSFLRQRYQAMIPAILSSADRSDQIRELAAEAEMAYLPKPVKGPALKRLVVSLLQRNLSI